MTDTTEWLPVIRQFADRGLQWVLEAPENARGLMSILAADIAERLDFSRMTREPIRFIAEDLHLRETDLVLRVPFRRAEETEPREVLVCLLVEHQSAPDAAIVFRLLHGMSSIWDYQRREFESRKLPEAQQRFVPVVPVLLYTGEEPWDVPLRLADRMDLPPALAEFAPQFRVLVLNLASMPPAKLAAGGHPFGLLLRAVRERNASAEAFESAVIEAVAALDSLADTDAVAWRKALIFLYLLVHWCRSEEDGRPVVEKMRMVSGSRREDVSQMVKTWWQTLEERGEAKGEARGEAKGLLRARQEDTLAVLAEKFGPVSDAIVQRIRALQDTEALGVLLRRAARANTLEDVGL